jgi:lipopolysaccharide export system permease protein
MAMLIPIFLSRTYLWSSFVAFLLIAVIVFLGDLVYMVRETSSLSIPTSEVMLLSLFRLPELVMIEMLPIVVLMGSTLATISLVRSRIFLVIQGYGLSLWMFLLGPFFTFGLLGLVVMLFLNPLSTLMYNRHVDILRLYQSGNVQGGGEVYNKDHVLWFHLRHEGGNYLVTRVEGLDGQSGRISGGVQIVTFDEEKRLLKTVYAERGLVSGHTWQLLGVTRVRSGREGIEEVPFVFLTHMPSLDELSRGDLDYYRRSFFDLGDYIEEAKSIGFDVAREERRYYLLWSLPLFLWGSVMSGMVLSSGLSHRGGGVIRVVTISLIFSVALFFVFKVLSFMAQAGILPAWLSAWFLPVVVCLLSFGLLLRYYET